MVATALPALERSTLLDVDSEPFPLSQPVFYAELTKKMRQAWILSVQDANEHQDVGTLAERYRDAFRAFSSRLAAIALGLSADANRAEQRDSPCVDEFRGKVAEFRVNVLD